MYRPTPTRRALGLGFLVTLVVLAVNACGGGAKPLSEEYGFLSLGRYVADEFQPALSFEVGKGWEVSELQQKPFFELSREYEGGDYFVFISFNNPPSRVSDPRNPNKLVPAPKEWVSWYQEHPYLETSEPQPTSVGDVQGRRLDITVSTLPEDYYSEDCLGMGVPLWPLLRGHHWCADEGYTDQAIVLDSIEGETVIIDIWSGSGTFEKVRSDAKEVLDTVEWEGA
jgi:hypothetical protein